MKLKSTTSMKKKVPSKFNRTKDNLFLESLIHDELIAPLVSQGNHTHLIWKLRKQKKNPQQLSLINLVF